MWQSYAYGLTVSASLIVAIGAQNAFVLAQGLRRQYPWMVAAICALCDLALIAAGVFGLAGLLAAHPLWLAIARWGGVAFLVAYALRSLRSAIHPGQLRGTADELPRSRAAVAASTFAVSLLNPHVYLDTVLLLGSIGARQPQPAVFAAGAMSTSLLWFFGLALGAVRLAPWLARPATWRALDVIVAAMMLWVAWGLVSRG